jgi:hypothetical protein
MKRADFVNELVMDRDVTSPDMDALSISSSVTKDRISKISDSINILDGIKQMVRNSKLGIPIMLTVTNGKNDIKIRITEYDYPRIPEIEATFGYKIYRMIVNSLSVETDKVLNKEELDSFKAKKYSMIGFDHAIGIAIMALTKIKETQEQHLAWLEEEI